MNVILLFNTGNKYQILTDHVSINKQTYLIFDKHILENIDLIDLRLSTRRIIMY